MYSQYFYFFVITALLLGIAFFDFLYYQIPNKLVILLFCFLFIRHPVIDLSAYMLPLGILSIGFFLAFINALGFGDSKLFAALSFGFGDILTLKLFVVTVLLGGVMGVLFIVFGKKIQNIRLKLFTFERIRSITLFFLKDVKTLEDDVKSDVYKGYLSYGIPIAFAGIVVSYNLLIKG